MQSTTPSRVPHSSRLVGGWHHYHGPLECKQFSRETATVAAETLAHAVEYLISSQLLGERADVVANRAAIGLLCDCIRYVGSPDKQQRSSPGRVAAFLRGAVLARAQRENAA